MTTIHIIDKKLYNTFLYILNDADRINSSFSTSIEQKEYPFFNVIAQQIFEHCHMERTGIHTAKIKDFEMHLSDLDVPTKLALLLADDYDCNWCMTFIAPCFLTQEPVRWLCQNYDLTLYCMYDDVLSCPPRTTFGEHIKFVYQGEEIPDISKWRIQHCTFTRSKEAQSFEKHFGNKLLLKRDHIEQYNDLHEEIDTDEYAAPYYFGDLLDELDIAENGKSEKNNSHYNYTAILSGGVFCCEQNIRYARIYFLSVSYNHVFGKLIMDREYTNFNILERLESIYECGNSDRLTAIITDDKVTQWEFANDYIPHIKYGVEIDFKSRTVYILDPTSAAVKFHTALQDSFIADEQHPHIYHG